MKADKLAATAILATGVPLLIGSTVDPYEDRLWATWRNGAIPIGIAFLLAWAGKTLEER